VNAVTHPGSLSRARLMPVLPRHAPAFDFRPPSPQLAELRREVPAEEAPAASASRYRGRSGRAPALAITLAIHVLLIGVVLSARMVVERATPPRALTTFEVAPPAPPPEPIDLLQPAAPAPTTPIVSPPPLVDAARPNPTVQTTTEVPQTPAPTTVAPPQPVVAPAPAAPAPAPPAPVTPPDFSAAQLNNPGPAYPFAARKAREQGVVLLRVLVTDGGRAGEVRLHESSGSLRLDQAALATVKRWKFVPAKQAGKPVQAWVLVPITFKLG
jgi:periplasmic protein TonB